MKKLNRLLIMPALETQNLKKNKNINFLWKIFIKYYKN